MSVADEDSSLALPSSSSSASNQNLGREDWLLRDSDLDYGLPDASQQSLPPGSSGTRLTSPPIFLAPQHFLSQAQFSSATLSSSSAARNNTSSNGFSLATSGDLPPAKKQIQSSTRFHCATCNQTFGTLAIYERHVRGHRCYPCEIPGCNRKFTTAKALQRHVQTTVHNGLLEANFYHCRCGKQRARKDNHKRHVLTCSKDRGIDYCCSCRVSTNEKEEHLAHIASCGVHKNRARIDTVDSDVLQEDY